MNAAEQSVLVNAMTVDLEEYFQVSAFEQHIRRAQWERLPGRVERNTDRILELFDNHGVCATFFVLGWMAQHYPGLVRRLADLGHEVASHGFSHVRVNGQSPTEFRQDVVRSKKSLEDLTGREVMGFRAASFSIGLSTLWAVDVLLEAGHRYSSSIYPVHHDMYGMPESPRFPYRHGNGGILEIPLTTIRLLGHNIPCAGGGFFRLYPYRISRWALRHVNEVETQAAVFYFHPWEIDPDQPRLGGLNTRTRFRHYFNLNRMWNRIKRLLEDFRWGRMDDIFLGQTNNEVLGSSGRLRVNEKNSTGARLNSPGLRND